LSRILAQWQELLLWRRENSGNIETATERFRSNSAEIHRTTRFPAFSGHFEVKEIGVFKSRTKTLFHQIIWSLHHSELPSNTKAEMNPLSHIRYEPLAREINEPD
jgi:hypothetical protein